MGIKFNPFTSNFDFTGSGGSGSGMVIGDSVSGATQAWILYVDSSGNLKGHGDLTFNETAFVVGGSTANIASSFVGSQEFYDVDTNLVMGIGNAYSGVTVNPTFTTTENFAVYGSGASDPALLTVYPFGNTVAFGVFADLGGIVSIQSIATTEIDLIIRAIAAQSTYLTQWQDSSGGQVLGIDPGGQVDFGTATQGVRISGATTGILTIAGYGNTRNENLTFNFETDSNKVTFGSGTGVNAISLASGIDLQLLDNGNIMLGNSNDTLLQYDTSESNHTFKFGLNLPGNSNGSGVLLICQNSDINQNFSVPIVSNPTLQIHSADHTDVSDYIRISHDQTNAVIDVGNGVLSITTDTTVTGAFRVDSSFGMGVTPTGVDTGWAVTNVTTDRTYDADLVLLSELADVVGTVIAALIQKGFFSA